MFVPMWLCIVGGGLAAVGLAVAAVWTLRLLPLEPDDPHWRPADDDGSYRPHRAPDEALRQIKCASLAQRRGEQLSDRRGGLT